MFTYNDKTLCIEFEDSDTFHTVEFTKQELTDFIAKLQEKLLELK